jgi:predicted phage tail protein
MPAVGSFRSIVLSWTNPTSIDLDVVEVWASQRNDRSTATMVGTAKATPGQPQSWTHTGLGSGETWYYWLRTRDRTGNVGNFRPLNPLAGVSATTQLIDESDLAATAEGTTRRLLEEILLELLRLLEVLEGGKWR